MRPNEQMIHVKGLGFFLAQKLSQQHIMPYAGLLATNPLEGGKLTPDPKITLRFPKGDAS
jgi:type IV secretion system protein VirD4